MSLAVTPILDCKQEILILLQPDHSLAYFLERCVDEITLSEDLIDLSDEPSLPAVFERVYNLLDVFDYNEIDVDDPFPIYVFTARFESEGVSVRDVYVQKSVL